MEKIHTISENTNHKYIMIIVYMNIRELCILILEKANSKIKNINRFQGSLQNDKAINLSREHNNPKCLCI